MIFASSMYCVIIFGVALVLPLWHNLFKLSSMLYNTKTERAVKKLHTWIEVGVRVSDSTCYRVQVKGKGKGHSITGHQGPRGGILILNLGAMRGWVVSTTPWPLYPREGSGTHCTGGWVGPRSGLEVCEKSHPHQYSIPGPSSP
jgi:hypothetical protein